MSAMHHIITVIAQTRMRYSASPLSTAGAVVIGSVLAVAIWAIIAIGYELWP